MRFVRFVAPSMGRFLGSMGGYVYGGGRGVYGARFL